LQVYTTFCHTPNSNNAAGTAVARQSTRRPLEAHHFRVNLLNHTHTHTLHQAAKVPARRPRPSLLKPSAYYRRLGLHVHQDGKLLVTDFSQRIGKEQQLHAPILVKLPGFQPRHAKQLGLSLTPTHTLLDPYSSSSSPRRSSFFIANVSSIFVTPALQVINLHKSSPGITRHASQKQAPLLKPRNQKL